MVRLKRVLCVCKNGNVRSTTLARILKGRGHQVLVLGAKDFALANDFVLANKEDVDIALAMCEWAEIIFCQRDSEKYLLWIVNGHPELYGKIDLRFDVGVDDWKIPMHPDLLRKMRDLVDSDPVWGIQSNEDSD